MAPEYAMEGKLSVKADVYSFGILLLELISGRRNFDFHLKPEMQILLEWVRGISHKGRNLVSTIDPVIIETCGDQGELALRCIHVGLLCTQAEASLRPSMSTINLMLSTPFMMLTDPTKPTFGSYMPTHDIKSTTNSGPSQPYAHHDPLGTLSSSVSSASAHTPIDSSLSPSNADAPEPAFRSSSTLPSSVSSTSSNNALPPPSNIDGSATPMVPRFLIYHASNSLLDLLSPSIIYATDYCSCGYLVAADIFWDPLRGISADWSCYFLT